MSVRAREKLKEAIAVHGISKLAKLCGMQGNQLKSYTLGSKPYDRVRQRLAVVAGVPYDWWDSEGEVPPIPGLFDDAASGSNRDKLSKIVAALQSEIPNLPLDTKPNHRAAMYSQLTMAVSKLAALDGEGELTVRMIVRSKAWAEISDMLRDVLSRYPDAAKELADRLEDLVRGR